MATKMPKEVRAEICKIAYDESKKGLDLQDATLASVRQSAVAIGTLCGLVATFLGREVLTMLSKPQAGVDCLTRLSAAVALTALFASLLVVADLLRPKAGWKLHSSARSILDQFADRSKPVDLDVVYEELAKFKEGHFESNKRSLTSQYPKIYVLIFLLFVQVVAWIFALLP